MDSPKKVIYDPPKKEDGLMNQTGGHTENFRKLPGNKIMKATNAIEFTFYEKLPTTYQFMQRWVPTFYGVDKSNNQNWIILGDITAGMAKPCVMDIKMGTCSFGEDANPEKREKMLEKDRNSTTLSMGLRITGAKVYNNKTQEYTQYNKPWGRKIVDSNFTEHLTQYFDNGDKIRYDIVENLKKKLLVFQEWMNNQNQLKFFSSSLLFVYDADATQGIDRQAVGEVQFAMIDFAHVSHIKEDNDRDQGYIFGLNNLLKQLDFILARKNA